MARKRCVNCRNEDFGENYNNEIRARISGISPKVLNDVDAKTRNLITICGSKPADYDHYRGEYGIKDTCRDGIYPYCITIDKEDRDYLPHMYGPAAYTVINERCQLPSRSRISITTSPPELCIVSV